MSNTEAPATILWLDFETDGLDFNCNILEAAVVLTDDYDNEVARYATLIQPPADLNVTLASNPFVHDMHTRSGLLADLDAARGLPDTAELDDILSTMVDVYGLPGAVCLAGSGVSHFDRHVIAAQMPSLHSRLPYWCLDVGPSRRRFQKSTGEHLVPFHPVAHRAMADVEDALTADRELHRIYQTEAAGRLITSSAEDRALMGVSLLDTYNTLQVNGDNDGVAHHRATVDSRRLLMDMFGSMPDQETIVGLLDAGTTLLNIAAEATGLDVPVLVDAMRGSILAETKIGGQADGGAA